MDFLQTWAPSSPQQLQVLRLGPAVDGRLWRWGSVAQMGCQGGQQGCSWLAAPVAFHLYSICSGCIFCRTPFCLWHTWGVLQGAQEFSSCQQAHLR